MYFDGLLNCDEPEEVFIFNQENENNIECPELNLEEIEIQRKRIKNKKSTREDEILIELLKKEGNNLAKRIWDLIKKVWIMEKLPKNWKAVILLYIKKEILKIVTLIMASLY